MVCGQDLSDLIGGLCTQQAKNQSDDAQSRYHKIVTLMEQDMVRFQESKTADLGLVLQEFARAQAQLANAAADAWGVLLPSLSMKESTDAYT